MVRGVSAGARIFVMAALVRWAVAALGVAALIVAAVTCVVLVAGWRI
jgi:hypothetical protein